MRKKRIFPVVVSTVLVLALGVMFAFSTGDNSRLSRLGDNTTDPPETIVTLNEGEGVPEDGALDADTPDIPPSPLNDGTSGQVANDLVDPVAGEIGGFYSGEVIAKPTATGYVLSTSNNTISIPFENAAFVSSTSTLETRTKLDRSKLLNQVAGNKLAIGSTTNKSQKSHTDDKNLTIDKMFDINSSFYVNEVNDTNGFADYPVTLILKTKSEFLQKYRDTYFEFDVTISFSGELNTAVSAEKDAKVFTISGKIDQADGSLTGAGTPYAFANTMEIDSPGKTYELFAFKDTDANSHKIFTYHNGDEKVNSTKVEAKKIQLSCTVEPNIVGFTPKFVTGNSGTYVVALDTPAAMKNDQTYTITINASSGNSDDDEYFKSGSIATLKLKTASTFEPGDVNGFNKKNEATGDYKRLDLVLNKKYEVLLELKTKQTSTKLFTYNGSAKQTFSNVDDLGTGSNGAGFYPMVVDKNGAEHPDIDARLIEKSGKFYIELEGVATNTSKEQCEIRLVNDKFKSSTDSKAHYFVVARYDITVSTTTSLSDAGTIDGIDTDYNLDEIVGLNGKELDDEDISSLEIVPGDILTLSFDTDYFTWSSGNKPYPPQQLSESMLSKGKITVVKKSEKNKEVIDQISIKHVSAKGSDQGYSYIEVKFVDPFPSTKELEFAVTLGLARNGKLENEITLEGTIANEVVEAYSGTTSLDISDGRVVEAVDSVEGIELDLGAGVRLTTNLRKGNLYYGYASTEQDDDDKKIFDKHSSIKQVYNLYTIGLNDSSSRVRLDISSNDYVYNSSLEYLGQGSTGSSVSSRMDYLTPRRLSASTAGDPQQLYFDQQHLSARQLSTSTRVDSGVFYRTSSQGLPYSTKYYIANQQIAGSDPVADIQTNPVVEDDGLGSTPGITPPENNNYNPGTGR